MIELNQLTAFLAVAEEGSFSVAAERIHLTQPAVSKRIAALEARLGQSLFNRIGRSIHLTEAGQLLIPQAEALLAQADDLERRMHNMDQHVCGVLSIGISHHIGLHRLPPVLKRFCHNYPDVELDISFIDSEQAYDAVLSGKMELGIVTLPKQPTPPINAHRVWRDELVIVTHPEHPLQKKRRTVQLSELSAYPSILPNRNTFTRRIIEQAFLERSAQLSVTIETNYLETNRMLISIGLGWGVIPRSMCDESVTILSIPTLSLERALGYIYHTRRSLSNAATAIIQRLEKEAT